MLKFITGAAGTGKSTRLREEITALAEKEKTGSLPGTGTVFL